MLSEGGVHRQRLVVPAYFDPASGTEAWDRLLAAGSGTVATLVANVGGGPGEGVEPAWSEVLARAAAEGITVLGYVDTGYLGATEPDEDPDSSALRWLKRILADVDAWYARYGSVLGGVFFDHAIARGTASASSELFAARYGELSWQVRRRDAGAMTVANPGCAVPRCFFEAADAIVTFEGGAASYLATDDEAAGWEADPARSWHLIHSVSGAGTLEAVLEKSRALGAGGLFATDACPPDPYSRFPTDGVWAVLVGMTEPAARS